MKKVKVCVALLTLLVCAVFVLSACGDKGKGGNGVSTEGLENNILVVYFSCTNNTKNIAEKIAEATEGALHRVIPQEPYSAADLNYNNSGSRANREQNDPSSRPQIEGNVDVAQFDVVFLGYPIWWGKLPKIMYTFLDECDLSGKIVVPFCTSGSSGIAASVEEIKREEPNATVLEGRRFGGTEDMKEIKTWLDGMQLPKATTIVQLHCGDNVLQMTLANNPSAKALAAKLREGDVTVQMDDYGNFEKTGALGFSLPRTDEEISTSAGDVILYLGNTLAIYYGENTWNFTRLGKIEGMTRETMLAFFGGVGPVTVTLSLAG